MACEWALIWVRWSSFPSMPCTVQSLHRSVGSGSGNKARLTKGCSRWAKLEEWLACNSHSPIALATAKVLCTRNSLSSLWLETTMLVQTKLGKPCTHSRCAVSTRLAATLLSAALPPAMDIKRSTKRNMLEGISTSLRQPDSCSSKCRPRETCFGGSHTHLSASGLRASQVGLLPLAGKSARSRSLLGCAVFSAIGSEGVSPGSVQRRL